MEVVLLAAVGLGGIYVITKNHNRNTEGFSGDDTEIPINYPVSTEPNKNTNMNTYENPNVATERYFNTQEYRNQVAQGTNEGSHIPDTFTTLNGDTINVNEFKHNNMVPFFGSKHHGLTPAGKNGMEMSESRLDNLNGTGSQYINKKESAPLFAPQDNIQWTHGTPNFTDFFQDRVNPSSRMANVKPFEEIRVAPGLDAGYGTEGTLGYNSGLGAREKWIDRGVDDLRVATNPKVSYTLDGHEGPLGPALSSMARYGSLGTVEKHQPDTFYENGPERYFTTTGVEKGQTSRSINILPYQNRPDTNTSYTGIAGGNFNKPTAVTNYTPSDKPYLNDSFFGNPNLGGRNGPTENDYNANSFVMAPNNRNTTRSSERFGGVGSILTAAVAPIVDVLRPTRKENFVGNKRVFGNMGKLGAGGEYVYNPGDTTRTTIRETTEFSPFTFANIQPTDGIGAYGVTKPTLDLTNRTTTACPDFGGPPAAPGEGYIIEEAARNQRNNVNKQSVSYFPSGNTNYFNNSMNVHISGNRGQSNDYLAAPDMHKASPGVDLYGKVKVPQGYNHDIGCDRIDPNLLNAFRQNPYTHSLQSVR